MTVASLDYSMTQSEYVGWMKFYSENPNTEQVVEIQLAVLMSMVSTKFGDKASPKDFMLSKLKKNKQVTLPFDRFNMVAKDFKGA